MREVIMGMSGVEWAILGAALAAVGGGIGSSIGTMNIANAASGLISEDSEKFGKVLILAAMPSTQALYGLITAVLVLFKIQLLTGGLSLDGFANADVVFTASQGLSVCFACLPVAIVCLFSGIYQGAAAAGAAGIVARRDEDSGKAIIMTALVETFAIFALITTVVMLLTI